jgi:hypothetical protein
VAYAGRCQPISAVTMKKVIELHQKYFLSFACLFIILAMLSGCHGGLPPGFSTEPPVLTNLISGDLITAALTSEIQSGSIKSILIWQMEDSKTTLVVDSQQISRIMARLSQVVVEKDLGTKETTLDGYIFKFNIKEDTKNRQMIMQVDSVANFNQVILGFLADRHFYQLTDQGDERFDIYFEKEMYK